MIALAIAALLFVALALASIRLLTGPTLYDRALAAHVMIVIAALAGASVAVALGRPAWIDVAIALVAADLVLAIAMLKFFRQRSMQPPMTRLAEERK